MITEGYIPTSGPARRSAICVRKPRSLHAYIPMALNITLLFRRYKKKREADKNHHSDDRLVNEFIIN